MHHPERAVLPRWLSNPTTNDMEFSSYGVPRKQVATSRALIGRRQRGARGMEDYLSPGVAEMADRSNERWVPRQPRVHERNSQDRHVQAEGFVEDSESQGVAGTNRPLVNGVECRGRHEIGVGRW